jgi:hypothetical protein
LTQLPSGAPVSLHKLSQAKRDLFRMRFASGIEKLRIFFASFRFRNSLHMKDEQKRGIYFALLFLQ